jgi:hypothetical protein
MRSSTTERLTLPMPPPAPVTRYSTFSAINLVPPVNERVPIARDDPAALIWIYLAIPRLTLGNSEKVILTRFVIAVARSVDNDDDARWLA